GQVVSQGVLVVKGVREDGFRERLAVEVAHTESEASYEALFRGLKDRGLRGVRLVTSDDHRGLVNAIRRHFQGVSWQRCQVHIARNALGKVGRKHQKGISEDIRAVFNAPSLEWAKELRDEVIERWSKTHPAVAEWLEAALEDGLACFAFPESHRRRIRSTNGLERFNQELKRRTSVVGIVPNAEACLRLVTALRVEQGVEGLAGRVYLDMRRLEDAAPSASEEEVTSMAAWPPTGLRTWRRSESPKATGLDCFPCPQSAESQTGAPREATQRSRSPDGGHRRDQGLHRLLELLKCPLSRSMCTHRCR